jgi:hypothetical protein
MTYFDSVDQARASVLAGDVVVEMDHPIRVVETRETDLLGYDVVAAFLTTVLSLDVEQYHHRDDVDVDALLEDVDLEAGVDDQEDLDEDGGEA